MVTNNQFKKAKRKYDVYDDHMFYNRTFLKESKMNGKERCKVYAHYMLEEIMGKPVLKFYKALKPGWFTPKVWIKR
jgi:hypothetical protein